MMASAAPPPSLMPLLETLEDEDARPPEKTDAYLTIANRLNGEEGKLFLPAVEKHFCRLGKATLAHITSPNAELCQAALQALGFCLYHSHVFSGVPESLTSEILSALCSVVVKSTDKNTCTRALWVISKQSFPPVVVAKKVPSILATLESVWGRADVQSVVMEHEALNVVIRLLEQVPAQMGEGAVRWARLVIPLVVHSASKVRLRAAAAMELGLPLLLGRQVEVAAIIEPIMSTKLIPELQKLFMSKNETNVLKLWPLFVKLLGKMLHRGGPFINSLLHLEELGFRSSSPTIKKIAFIAWKSLIDNFALNPDILCSSKRMKLLMQPLASINVRTEALLLTKVEVWWYLVVQLGPNLSPNFDQVSVPLLQCVIVSDSHSVPGTPARSVSHNGVATPATPKTVAGDQSHYSPANASLQSLNSSVLSPASAFPSVQLLGLEMLLHYLLGPEVTAAAAKNKLVLNLEPLNHPLLSGASSFTKHASVLTSNIRDGFTNIGKDAPESLLAVIWTSLVRFVNLTIDSGSKKDRHGGEVLTMMLQVLQSLVTSEALPADKVLILFEATVKGIPQRVLGSTSYQVGKMDVLNGTPALFLVLLLYNSSMLSAYLEDERFFQTLQTLVACGLSGPTSPLAFGEAVLGAMGRTAGAVHNKEQLWRMWSVVVGPLTDTITQSNEVNQGDALEHNFSAMHSALMFPPTHLLRGTPLQPASQKSLLVSWARLYSVFACCSSLVVTAEENICCEELCAKMAAVIDREALKVPSTLNAVSSILQVVVDCVDFSPYTPQFQQKLKSPHTPVNWMRKRNKVLGNLSSFQSLLVQCLEVYLERPDEAPPPCEHTGLALVSVMSTLFSSLVLSHTVEEALASLLKPLTLLFTQASGEKPQFTSHFLGKLEKLLGDVLGCLQTRSALPYDDQLLARLCPLLCVSFPHRNKHVRTAVAHFWNATFAKSVSLTYPDEIRPILIQVKQKTPIILPGFEVVSVSDECSGTYSSESSQLDTKLSGMAVSSVGKRDSMLHKTPESKDRSSMKSSKPVSTKLDFGSPKLPRRDVLEEEASVDFVFIPPETKERVLTEHQKEVKRTKRVDIPAMYNNLDASLDTTAFSQYTQSQEDTLDKPPAEEPDKVTADSPAKVSQEVVEKDGDLDVLTKDTQDFASPTAEESVTEHQEQAVPESTDVSMEDGAKSDAGEEEEDMDAPPEGEDASPNVSGSSDLISGTPPRPNSRRQSFITLEKYAEGKPASPSTSFTGSLRKNSKTKTPSSQRSTGTNSQGSQSSQAGDTQSQRSVNDTPESPKREKNSAKCEPVRLTERLPSDTAEDDDVIPDTQTAQMEAKDSTNMSEELTHSVQEEDSQSNLDDTQSSQMDTSPGGEPRRSGRQRVRPQLPGEGPGERDDKQAQSKRKRSAEEPKGGSQRTSPTQSKPNTRSKNVPEEDGSSREGSRTRSRRDKSESSQPTALGRRSKKVKLFSNSQDFLDSPEPRRRSARDHESSQTDTPSDQESQSQGRPGRPKKSTVGIKEEEDSKKKVLPDKKVPSQTASLEPVDQATNDDKPQKDSQILTPSGLTGSKSQELVEQTEKVDVEPKRDSEMVISSPQIATTTSQTDGKPQEPVEPIEKDEGLKTDSGMDTSQVGQTTSNTGSKSQEQLESIDKEELKAPELAVSSSEVLACSETADKSQEQLESIDKEELKDPELAVSSPEVLTSETADKSQESQVVENTKKEDGDSQTVASSSPPTDNSQERTGATKKLKAKESTDDNLSQDDSQASESQSLRRSRRSKALDEATESQDSSDNKDPSGRRSRSSSQAAVDQTEARVGGRGRRSRPQEEQSSACSSPEKPHSLDLAASRDSAKGVGRGRYSRRRTSQTLVANVESSESESPEPRDSSPVPKRRGRKPRASLPSPLTLESSKADQINNDTVKDDSQKEETQSVDDEIVTDLNDSQMTQDLQGGGESSEARDNAPAPRRRGRPRAALPSPLTLEPSKADSSSDGPVKDNTDHSQKDDAANAEGKNTTDLEDSQMTQDLQGGGSSEASESAPMPKKRGRKPQAALPSPLALEPPKADNSSDDPVEDDSQKGATENVEDENVTNLEDPPTSQDLQGSESDQVTPDIEEKSAGDSPMEVHVDAEADDTEKSAMDGLSPLEDKQIEKDSKTNLDNRTLHENDTGDLENVETVEAVESVGISSTEQSQEPAPPAVPDVDTPTLPDETTDRLLLSQSSEERARGESQEPGEGAPETQNHPTHQAPSAAGEDTSEDSHGTAQGEEQTDGPNAPEDFSKEEEDEPVFMEEGRETEVGAVEDITPLPEGDKEADTQISEGGDKQETGAADTEDHEDVRANLDAALAEDCDDSVLSESSTGGKDVLQGSPAKQKDLEALMGMDSGQSPGSGGRTRGTWSPSASPSTSILKKGQKRPVEDETPSPLVKFRRVSFADPIQHQELADDIDRRSPAVRTSSPRRPKATGIPQPKYVTTPTKGLMMLSPRNLHSPGYKSSKKCLISEMSHEPRPVSKDCIYPALVGCSAPVEAVLPQISSNMWSRGFGQLVRARNIKTVGDLSALTPTEIKTLPIRSPKISNVKKALKTYEQQRKGRGVDELKSFDETEMMTSEAEVHEEEDKTAAETLATALVDEPAPSDVKPEPDCSGDQTAITPAREQIPGGALLSHTEALSSRMTPQELSHCSPQQLLHIHDQLGGMMKSVVVQMHTRLTPTQTKP